MKCNVEKINAFFNDDKFDKEIKDFVINLFIHFFKEESRYSLEPIQIKFLFLSLNFFKEEKDDFDNYYEDGFYVIDFYTLSLLNIVFKKEIIKLFESHLKNGDTNDFFEDFMINGKKLIEKIN